MMLSKTKWKLMIASLILLLFLLIHFHMMGIRLVSNAIPIISRAQLNSSQPRDQPIRCIVYIKTRSGRIGNRMFIIASGYGLARLHSCHLYLTTEIINEMKSIFAFNLSSLLISPYMFGSIANNILIPMPKTTKNVVCQYLRELSRPNAITQGSIYELTDYWQSYLHFAKYGDELRQHVFAAKPLTLHKVAKLFDELHHQLLGFAPSFSLDDHHSFKTQLAKSNWTTWIGVHIRRSDFVSLGFVSSDQYLLNSIEYYVSRYSDARFLVASDDKPYCYQLFRNRSDVFFTPRTFSVGDDLIALSLCEHSIVTGGTFGWWTGYLANGEVTHDSMYPSGCEKREHYYPPWFLIDGKVRAHKNTNYTL